jgi:hypothetical protein
VQIFVNTSPDADTSGEWKRVYSGEHTGTELDLIVPISTKAYSVGTHRLGMNVHFEDGSICYWYSQPPHFLTVGQSEHDSKAVSGR